MNLARGLAVVAPLLAFLACGGAVETLGNGGNGGDAGPDGSPPPGCPSAAIVGEQGYCPSDDLTCPGTLNVSFCGSTSTTTTQCTCIGNTWQCPVVMSGGCPAQPVPCPAPSTIAFGGSCQTDPSLSCPSDIPVVVCDGQTPYGYVDCNCQDNAWDCAMGAPTCPVEAGPGCPSPDDTYAGEACDDYGVTCGGDPQLCGSLVVYDALQCQGGEWAVVASTSCDVDAGIGAQDAGIGPDF